MAPATYTAITFAPVQGFIEKSRKLRDLYGSSLLLSLMAEVICRSVDAKPDCRLISPALVNNAKGTPNQILIKGQFPEAETIFKQTWKAIVDTCRQTIEQDLLPGEEYHWKDAWNRWGNYAWEYFQEEVEVDATDNNGIDLVRQKMNERKRERNWIGINWQGESSSLSGIDGVAFPGMDGYQAYCTDASKFCTKLAQALPDSILDGGTDNNPNGEQLSIPELVKRLILLDEINCPAREEKINLNRRINEAINGIVFPQRQGQENPVLRVKIERPPSFQELNRKEKNEWTGWFMGDGDEMGKYLQGLGNQADKEDKLIAFSQCLIDWGKELETNLTTLKAEQGLTPQVNHRIVYAGGDDFFGIFSPGDQFSQPNNQETFKPKHCLPLLRAFHQTLWVENLSNELQTTFGKPLNPSVGFVWAAPDVPQRDVIQHCRDTESAAKNNGRDRLAIRILFNSGNHLDWHCPWWFLTPLTQAYRDRIGGQNWTHFYNDVAILEARHAFTDDSDEVALALLDIYFRDEIVQTLENNRRGTDTRTAILPKTDAKTLNQWVVNLAKVGFQLYD